MGTDNTAALKTAFGAIVRPQPYLPDEKIEELAVLFSDPVACASFFPFSGSEYKEEWDVLQCLSGSSHPAAKGILKNLLLFGSKSKSPLRHYDGNRFMTAELLGQFDPADRKELLCKPWMIADMVDAQNYHWNDEAVIQWIDDSSPEDRLDILCADAAIYALLTRGENAIMIERSRPKVMEWFLEQSNEAKAKMLKGYAAARSFIEAFGYEGMAIVEHYVPQEERADILSSKSMLFHCFKGDLAEAFIRSLSPEGRESFFNPEQIYFGKTIHDGMNGAGLKQKFGF